MEAAPRKQGEARPRISTLACSQLGVAPERCLYVRDGGSEELAGAERRGMTALGSRVPYETPPDYAQPWSAGRRSRH